VDVTTGQNPISSGASLRGPAFSGVRWNGWALTALAIVCFLGFIVAQLGLLIWVLFRSYPDVLRSPQLQQDLSDPSFIVTLLTAKNLWLTSVGSEAVLALMTVGLAQMAFRTTPAQLGLTRPTNRNWPMVGIVAGIVLVVASTIIEAVIRAIFGSHPQPQALVLAKHHGAFAFALDLMSVSVAAPIAEELFFRGFIFAGLVQRMSPVLAMMISAVLFGAAHGETWSFLSIFVIGCGLAWVYYTTRSLWVNVVAHATINTISLVIAYTFPQYIK
jgi:membrane protease YdiL (CAAX protease family)